MNELNTENIISTLPYVLTLDPKMVALAQSIANVLARRMSEIETLMIYERIDQLPEDLLDILAYDFKVDWWDYSYTIEEKRATLKNSWYVHRHMGTKAAVETAISAIYPNSKVKEWWEYDGDPYHFRLIIPIDSSTLDPVKHAAVLRLVDFYKNLRSVLDEIEYIGGESEAPIYVFTACTSQNYKQSATATE